MYEIFRKCIHNAHQCDQKCEHYHKIGAIMLTYQPHKRRLLCWLLNESQNVEANLSVLKDYEWHHGENDHFHTASVIKELTCNLRQKEAVSHQVLHIINSSVRYHMNCHI